MTQGGLTEQRVREVVAEELAKIAAAMREGHSAGADAENPTLERVADYLAGEDGAA